MDDSGVSLEDKNVLDGGEVLLQKRVIDVKPVIVVVLVIAVIFIFALAFALAYFGYVSRLSRPGLETKIPIPTPVVSPAELSRQKNLNPKAMELSSDISAWKQEVDSLDIIEPQLARPGLDLKITLQVE